MRPGVNDRCTVVVPCFDEAERLDPEAFLGFAARHPNVRFLFVDDGSRDDTRARIDEICERAPAAARCIAHGERAGKAEAVRTGVRAALEEAPDFVGYWDADLSTPLDAIPDLLACLAADPDAQIALGSRVKVLGRRIERQAWRHYLGRVFATAASITLQLPVYDTQCGAKLLRATPEVTALFEAPWRSGWIFDVELLARFIAGRRAAGLDPLPGLVEVPLRAWSHRRGSKIGPRDFLAAPLDLLRIARWLRAGAAPPR